MTDVRRPRDRRAAALFYVAIGPLALAIIAAFSCMRIEVDPVLMPPVPAIPDPSPDAPLVEIRIIGQDMERSDWAKALTISRFFYTRVENRSGSPQKLLEPALIEVLRQCGYRSRLPASSTNSSAAGSAPPGPDYVFELEAERNLLLWLPPREFIQTPKPRARGAVRIDLLYHSRLAAGEKTLWSGRFADKQELTVLPGDEDSALSRTATRSFQDYLRELQIELPRAHETAAPGSR